MWKIDWKEKGIKEEDKGIRRSMGERLKEMENEEIESNSERKVEIVIKRRKKRSIVKKRRKGK